MADEEFELKCRLIEEMQLYPLIYDKAHPFHYKKEKRDEIFDSIGAILGITGLYLLFKCMILQGKARTQ